MRTILVLSGKGGVGKSSTTAQLALALNARGKRVGVLDIDLCGPSLPLVFGIRDAQIMQSARGWMPVEVRPGLYAMSIGFLLEDKDAAIVWRGPKKQAMISQFVTDVDWTELDYLLVDTPPGTSDEHLAILDAMRKSEISIDGAVLVTTPQELSLADVRKEYNFCIKVQVPVLGVIENMSGYVCPHCKDCVSVFSRGGGEAMAKQFQIPFLGRIPIDPQLARLMDSNTLVQHFQDLQTAPLFGDISERI